MLSGEELESFINETGWIISYMTEREQSAVMRLGIVHPRIDAESLALYAEGDFALIMPVEATESEASRYQELISSMQKPIGEFETVEAHYGYHRLLCGAVVEQAASQFRSVSCSMHLGVQTTSGQIDTTDLLEVPETRGET